MIQYYIIQGCLFTYITIVTLVQIAYIDRREILP